MDKDVFQIEANENSPLTEWEIEYWNNLFRTWKKLQTPRSHKIIREKYNSDADFVKAVADLTMNKNFHEALIEIHQKLVENFIEEIRPYWTGLEKDKNSVIALLCTKYGLDIDQARSLFTCPNEHYSRHPWGLYISAPCKEEEFRNMTRSDQIVWLLTKGEEELFDRLYRLPTPKDKDIEKRQKEIESSVLDSEEKK